MWTVVNLVDRLKDRFEFGVVTKNHDGVGDLTPFRDVFTGEWNYFEGHQVFYADPKRCSKRMAADLVNEFRPDALFFNSVFGLTTRIVLEARRKGLIDKIPVVIAPCGELSDQCLAIKPLKKSTFLKFAKMFRFYDGVIWKASTELEAAEVRQQFGPGVEITVAPDIAPSSILPDFQMKKKPEKQPGKVKLVCVARVAPKKNIVYLLECLSKCRNGEYELELIGGIDDEGYFEECKRLIRALPKNVNVDIVGPVRYEEVLQRLSNSHFFVLPTLNENFGYFLLEALAAGCPPLISENTIWSGVEDAGCGRVLNLAEPYNWIAALERCSEMDSASFSTASGKARKFAMEWLSTSEDTIKNSRVLESAVSRNVTARFNVESA